MISEEQTTADWQSELPPELSLGIQVRLLFRALDRLLGIYLAPWNCPSGHWYLLRALRTQDGTTQGRLADINNVTESTLTIQIVRMEKAGLVVRKRSEGDKRKVHVFMTEKGKELYEGFMPWAININEIATRGIDKAKIDTVLDVLKSLTENVLDELLVCASEKGPRGTNC